MKYIACKYIGESKSLGRFGFIEKDSIQMLTTAEWRYVDTHGKSFELVTEDVKEVTEVETEVTEVMVKEVVVRSRTRTNTKLSSKKP